MQLILAPSKILETPVDLFDYSLNDPLKISNSMIGLMYKHSGLGLSANQVGLNAQIFVMKTILNKQWGDTITVINPVITALSKESEAVIEGCLSYTGLLLKVKRPISCVVEFDSIDQNKNIIRVETKFDDIDARIFLHEYDHLHGIQFVDRVSKLKLQLANTKKLKRKKNG